MAILTEDDWRCHGIGAAWEEYAKMYRLQKDAATDAARRAFAFAYEEGYRAGVRTMADRLRGHLALTVDELQRLVSEDALP